MNDTAEAGCSVSVKESSVEARVSVPPSAIVEPVLLTTTGGSSSTAVMVRAKDWPVTALPCPSSTSKLKVSAVVSSREILSVFRPGDHGSTFGGNPLACAVAREAIRILKTGELQRNATELGNTMIERLRAERLAAVKEIRGRGLWIAVEIKESAGRARPYCEELMRQGLLCKETHQQSLRLAPPLVMTKEECEWALERLIPVLANQL